MTNKVAVRETYRMWDQEDQGLYSQTGAVCVQQQVGTIKKTVITE